MKPNKNQQAFLTLLRAGLWEKEARLLTSDVVDFACVYKLAQEQSVAGLVAAGLEHVRDVKVPREVALTFAGATLQIEQRNTAMNAFVAKLMLGLRDADIFALLVKGQGIAQCYERPLWRAFAALAVDYLGMPADAMPLYSDSRRWRRKAAQILRLVFRTGNMGHNQDWSYVKRSLYLVRKAISFGRHCGAALRHLVIFPWHSVVVWWRVVLDGVAGVARGI